MSAVIDDGDPGPLDRALLAERGRAAVARLAAARAADPPITGGRLLSYVYDPGLPELDEAQRAAAGEVHGVNGLDPTAFESVHLLEREILDTVGAWVYATDGQVFGTVTSGGTESCILAVTGSLAHRAPRRHVVAATTVHPAFRKAVALVGAELTEVSIDASTGALDGGAVLEAIRPDTALVVLSAPNYPLGTIDPVAEVAAGIAERGLDVDLHVDACIGGLVLPFWPHGGSGSGAAAEGWDFRIPQVTSMSADLHKYGFAPKGASTLFVRGRARHRASWFACGSWPGYPVVNPTLLGTRAVGGIAGAWTALQVLGEAGFTELTARTHAATAVIAERLPRGLRLYGQRAGQGDTGVVSPLLALAADTSLPAADRSHPHLVADAMRHRGVAVQCQAELTQPDGSVVPPTVHLTITPVTLALAEELLAALHGAADEVRGMPDPEPPAELRDILDGLAAGLLTEDDLLATGEDDVHALVSGLLGGDDGQSGTSGDMAPLLAGIAALPRRLADRLLRAYLAGHGERPV